MKEYYIKHNKWGFWCENNEVHLGYWSHYKSSLKYRFQGFYFKVFFLYLVMKGNNVNCSIKRVK